MRAWAVDGSKRCPRAAGTAGRNAPVWTCEVLRAVREHVAAVRTIAMLWALPGAGLSERFAAAASERLDVVDALLREAIGAVCTAGRRPDPAYGEMLRGLSEESRAIRRSFVDGGHPLAAAGTLLRDVSAVIRGLTEPPADTGVRAHITRAVRERWEVAAMLVAASGTGASLVLWHWWTTPWLVREAELSGAGDVIVARATAAFATPVRVAVPLIGLALLASGGLLGWVVFAGRQGKRVACAAGWTLIALAPLHLAEALLVRRAVAVSSAVPAGGRPDWSVFCLQGVAFLGYALLPVAGVVAALGALMTVVRMVASARMRHRMRESSGWQTLPAWRPVPGEHGSNAHWYDSAAIPDREPGGLGICLSGGGIRSATFTLGAMQALQAGEHFDGRPSELSRARYLTAVSGGAYTAGAFLLALRPRPGRSARARRRCLRGDDVFRPGSPEFDHLRRNSSYIADGPREWAVAILVVLRGAIFSTFFLDLVSIVTGRWVGLLYRSVDRGADLENPWYPLWAPIAATAVVAAVAVLLWFVSTSLYRTGRGYSPHAKARRLFEEAAILTCLPLAVLVVIGAAVPVVTRISMAIVERSGIDLQSASAASTVANGATKGGLLGLSGIVVTIAGLLYRQHTEIANAVEMLNGVARKMSARLGDLGRRAAQAVTVYLGVVAVVLAYAILFGFTTYTTAHADPDAKPTVEWGNPHWTFPFTNSQLTYLLTVILILLYLFVDETGVGLHPFYRRRLAHAFAVRRKRRGWRPGRTAGYTAERYGWDETTELETYGDCRGSGFPHVIFCAAAHCSDPERTPPGRHVLPFTLSYDAIGGPEVGWCAPDVLRRVLPSRLGGDLTVQAAMAVSGAAFASATGSFQGPANLALGLLNARLGVWYPNLTSLSDCGYTWCLARPPGTRRMSYLVREICGWHPKDNALLFVSDGGHYDNLGLVELLRHRCTEIYCFDATSDPEAFAASIARSITLARDELGVDVRLDDPDATRPKATADASEQYGLGRRIAGSPIITGTVKYPALEPGSSQASAILIIGRSVLDPETPWDVLRHAAGHPMFPYDASGDQWFDHAKFNAYTALGRHVGGKAVAAMELSRWVRDHQHRSVASDPADMAGDI